MTEVERQALQDARAACLASAAAIAAVLDAEFRVGPAIPRSEYVKAGTAAVWLRVSKKTILRRCREGQGKRIGGLWYMHRSFAIGLDVPEPTTSCSGTKAGVGREHGQRESRL